MEISILPSIKRIERTGESGESGDLPGEIVWVVFGVGALIFVQAADDLHLLRCELEVEYLHILTHIIGVVASRHRHQPALHVPAEYYLSRCFAVTLRYRDNGRIVEFACHSLSERPSGLGLYAVAEVMARHVVLRHVGVYLYLVYHGTDPGIRK